MYSLRFFVIACLASSLNFGCAQKRTTEEKKTSEGCLDYSFGKEYPYTFKFYNGKAIVGDGRKLVVFNSVGKETGRLVLPSSFLAGQNFLDFLPVSDTSYLITVYGNLYEVTPKTQKLLSQDFGELLKGKLPIAITISQQI